VLDDVVFGVVGLKDVDGVVLEDGKLSVGDDTHDIEFGSKILYIPVAGS
jgi:hypothetical protein